MSTIFVNGLEVKEEYPYIRAWGKYMGSKPYFIKDEKERAKKDGAPQNALYKRNDGTWATTEDMDLVKVAYLEFLLL